MPCQGFVPSSSIFTCLGHLPPPLSSYDARSGFCAILLHLLLSWPSPSSLVQLGCHVWVLYHPPPSSPVLAVSFLPCPAMMPGQGSVPSSSIFSSLGRLPPPLSSCDARSGFCTILLHLLQSWPSPSSLVQLGCQVRVLYHPPPSSPVMAVSLLPCPARMPGQGSVPSSSIFSCLGRLLPPLSRCDAMSGFCIILLHLLLSWLSPSSLVQLRCQVRVLYHPPSYSPVLDVSFLPCPAVMPGLGSVPSSSIFSCLGYLLPPLSSYEVRCQVRVLYHPPSSSPVLVISFLPCPATMPGQGSVPSSFIFSCLGRLLPPLSSYDAMSGFCILLLIFSCLGYLLPPLSSYDARSGFCTILLHILLYWMSPSSLVQR